MSAAILNVNGIKKLSTDLTYDDLVWLYWDYINRNHKIPTTSDGLSKNNLPQCRIIKKILEDNNVMMNDFLNQFGKVSHVRTESKDYEYFVNKYKQISEGNGHALTSYELTNNAYGLPSAGWFIKYCPDSNVQSFDDFVKWCGFKSNKQTKNKDEVIKCLHELEEKLGRPITINDITTSKVGFSMIVISRIWGTLSNCKKELGLLPTQPNPPRPFEYYKTNLDLVLNDYKQHNDSPFITWKDIESNKIVKLEHKTLTAAFKREDMDVISYIKQQGLNMNPSTFSFHYCFDDGEIAVSTFEYNFSKYLRKCGLVYSESYFRNIMYKDYFPNQINKKINCDYIINDYWIEIVGIISNVNNNWENNIYTSKQENDYKTGLLLKKSILETNNIPYIFLFPEDFISGNYKTIINQIIGKEVKYA